MNEKLKVKDLKDPLSTISFDTKIFSNHEYFWVESLVSSEYEKNKICVVPYHRDLILRTNLF